MHRFLFFIIFFAISPSAHALYKCQEANGKIAYQSDPCAASKDITPPSVKAVIGKEKKYVGERIKLNFEAIDIRMLLQVIGDFSGKSVRTGKEVQGKIPAHYDAAWDQVLDQLAARYGLTITVEGDQIIVNKKS